VVTTVLLLYCFYDTRASTPQSISQFSTSSPIERSGLLTTHATIKPTLGIDSQPVGRKDLLAPTVENHHHPPYTRNRFPLFLVCLRDRMVLEAANRSIESHAHRILLSDLNQVQLCSRPKHSPK
jgi:hypothetical protein